MGTDQHPVNDMALTLCRKAPPRPCVVVAPTKRHAADSMQYVILHARMQ